MRLHAVTFPRPALLCVISMALTVVLSAAHGVQPAAEPPLDVDALVEKLGDERYAVREEAARQLLTLGPRAAETLRRAQEQGAGEAALRAARILDALEQCYFWGATVELTWSVPTLRWDESIDLVIRFTNTQDFPVRLPFVLPDAEQPITDAQQVGVLLDAADYVRIEGPDGTALDAPVLDDLSDDADVQRVVDERAAASESSLLPPGREVTMRIRNINRGWARFRMLEQGEYRAAFEFAPEWEDETLSEAQVGRVASPPATVTITQAAPPAISRDGALAGLVIEQTDKRLAAYLENQYDKPLRILVAFGAAAPFAQFDWSCTHADGEEVDVPYHALRSDADEFQLADLREVPPGGRLLLAETTIADLFADYARQTRSDAPARLSVRARYNNIVTRNWQRRENTLDVEITAWPVPLRTLLPPRVLGTRLSSETLTLENTLPVPETSPPAHE